MALYCKWDGKNGFAYVLQFFSLIYDSLDSVDSMLVAKKRKFKVFPETCANST